MKFNLKEGIQAWRNTYPHSDLPLVLHVIWDIIFAVPSIVFVVTSIVVLTQAAAVSALLFWVGVLFTSLATLAWIVANHYAHVEAYRTYKEYWKGIKKANNVEDYIAQHESAPHTLALQAAFWFIFIASTILIVVGLSLFNVSSMQSIWMVPLLNSVLSSSVSMSSFFTFLSTVAVISTPLYFLLTRKTSLLYEDRKMTYQSALYLPGSLLKQALHLAFIILSIACGSYGFFSLLGTAFNIGLLLTHLVIALSGVGFLLVSTSWGVIKPDDIKTSNPNNDYGAIYKAYQANATRSMKAGMALMGFCVFLAIPAWVISAPLLSLPLMIMLGLTTVVSLLGFVLLRYTCIDRENKNRNPLKWTFNPASVLKQWWNEPLSFSSCPAYAAVFIRELAPYAYRYKKTLKESENDKISCMQGSNDATYGDGRDRFYLRIGEHEILLRSICVKQKQGKDIYECKDLYGNCFVYQDGLTGFKRNTGEDSASFPYLCDNRRNRRPPVRVAKNANFLITSESQLKHPA